MSKILITGANGQVGKSLVPYIDKMGVDYKAINRNDCDLCLLEETTDCLRSYGADFTVHLASKTNPNRNLNEFCENFQNIIQPAINVALSLPESTKLAIFLGSIEEYGTNQPPFVESLSPDAISGYGWAKISSFHAVKFICKQRNIPFVWIRPALFFGPDIPQSRFIGHVIYGCLADKSIDLTTCEQTRDLLYVGDFCRMFAQIIERPLLAEGKILNFCSGTPRRLKDIASLIQQIIGKGTLNLGALPHRSNEVMDFYSDTGLFNSIYGEFEFTPIHKALTETINAIKTKN